MQEQIYIIGHQNPDTDSICSAIAYAEFQKILGFNALPFRLGELSAETEFVLNYFDIPAPPYLETVKTQVSDLNMDPAITAAPDVSVNVAWNLMKKNSYKALPVVDESRGILGIVTLSDITNMYLAAPDNNIIAAANTPLRNILETLDAGLVYGEPTEFRTSGKVVIAAMTPDEMEPFIETGDIVLVGNRKDSQIKAIDLGAKCLIITCKARIAPEVIEKAGENRCIVMMTPHDTFNTSRLINLSVPVGYTMTAANLVCFNLEDFVDDIKDRMMQTRFRSYPVVDDERQFRGFISRYHLISPRKKKVILLDHNEKSQTVDGVEQAEILEIIDHHRVGDIQTVGPIYVSNQPVGSTATIIANKFFDRGRRLAPGIAGILCAAVISDTVKFKSPTSTEYDVNTAKKLASIAAIDIESFADLMFKKATSLKGKTVKQILSQDFKKFHFGKYRIGIGQISTTNNESIHEMETELLLEMQKLSLEKNYNLVLLMVTDILKETSEIFFAGPDKLLLAKAFDATPGENSILLPGVISRKKQVVPNIAQAAML